MDRIITGDEKWVLYDSPNRKYQLLSPGEQPAPTAKPNIHGIKVLLCVWWIIYGIVHYELLKPGETITEDFYSDQLTRLNDAIGEKHPALANRIGVILQQDNARPRSAKKTQEIIR